MKLTTLLFGLFVAAFVSAASARAVLIDVRTPAEYSEGHLEGAINIDHSMIVQQILRAGAGKDDEIILYCRSGRRSAIAQDALKAQGYKRVLDYGGIDDARKRLSPKK